jgi:hypothetical protein
MTDPDVVTERRLADDRSPHVRDGWAAARFRTRSRRRWCRGTRLVVAASLAWLLFVLVHRLLSGRTWLWGPLDLIPPLAFVAVPAALLVVAPFARPVRWRIMAVQVISGVLGASLSGINLATLWYVPPPAPPGAITLVSWNTEFWDQSWGSSGKDVADLYRYLRALNADVYQLSEYLHVNDHGVVRIDLLPQLRREFPAYHIAVVGELITLSRFPIVRYHGLDLRPWLPAGLKAVPPALRGFPAYYTAKMLRADVLVNGTTISFYNGHVHQPSTRLSLYSDETRRANRDLEHLRRAGFRALQADVNGNRHPVVVGADLNSSAAMGIRRLLPDRLVDHTRALSSVYPATWKAGGIELWRIDWLLTTPDVAVHRYDVLGPDGMSDHRAQRAILSVEQPD